MRRALFAHLLMSVGVLSALFALLAVFDQSWELVYGWLGISLIVQGIQSIWLPPVQSDETDSESLGQHDPIATVLTCCSTVLVPIVAMLHAGFLDGLAGVIVAALVILAALYRMAFQSSAAVSHFHGLPASWSVIGFYLHAFDATPPVAGVIIGLGIVLGLIPRNWPHPLHSEWWPTLTRAVAALWLAAAAITLVHGFPGTPAAKTIFLAAIAYGLIVSTRISAAPPATPVV